MGYFKFKLVFRFRSLCPQAESSKGELVITYLSCTDGGIEGNLAKIHAHLRGRSAISSEDIQCLKNRLELVL